MKYSIEYARADDRDAILAVMRYYNMHHVPSAEMEELDLDRFLVARIGETVVGAGGYKLLNESKAKTTLLGVIPEYSGLGIGKALQLRRMEAVYALGARTMLTNADRPETILWYKKHFRYRPVGRLKKMCAFGLEDVDHWTTIETDLEAFFREAPEREGRRLEYMAQNDAHPLAHYSPLIINVCPTGMVPTKMQTPYVPITPDEIIETAIDAYDAGASMVHLHARGADGTPTPEPKYYEQIILGIRRERPEMVCCATTSGRNWSDFERRAAVLYLDPPARPDMASLTLGSLNFLTNASTNTIEMVERLAMAMREQGVAPEMEVFDLGMINLARYLERNGIISGTKYFNLLLGNLNTAPATIGALATLIAALPADSVWGAAGLGAFQLPMNVAAIVAGGHVRVGLEDSIYYDYDKTKLASNRELIERVSRIACELQRPIASVMETREILGLGRKVSRFES